MRVIVGATAAILGYKMSGENLDNFVGGLIFGMVGHNDTEEIKKCLKDSTDLEDELDKALQDLHGATIADLLNGTEELTNVVWKLPTDLESCPGDMKKDVEIIRSWSKSFINPVKLMNSLTTNLPNKYNDIMTNMASF